MRRRTLWDAALEGGGKEGREGREGGRVEGEHVMHESHLHEVSRDCTYARRSIGRRYT